MNHVELVRRKQRLDSLYSRVSAFTSDTELAAHWARYLCVLTSGFIEQAVKIILTDHAERCSHTRIANFVESELGNFQSAKTSNILSLIGKFDPAWRDELEKVLDERLTSAINSIVGNRHQIAHGNDVGLSFARLREYYTATVEAIELIELQCH